MADPGIAPSARSSAGRLPVLRRAGRSLLAAAALLSLPGCAQNEAAPRQEAQSLTADERKLLRTFLDEFVEITPGTGRFPRSFEMGSSDGEPSERPVHTVTFNHSFAIARHEVPQDLYRAVMRQNPSVWQGPGRDRNACEMMTWREAVQFCQRVTQLLRAEKLLDDDEVIRLPSEAEWEYCCRAGTTTAYSIGDDALAEGDGGPQTLVLDAYAWHTGNAAGNDPAVGVLKPNAWGLHDMHGYLWEYVADAWHDSYDGAPADGSARDGAAERGRRVIRGGSWREAVGDLRSATRWPVPDHVRSDAIGFRCVKAGRAAAGG
ncbi:MAG TPA: formylglycine-generating enzyme family protein [Planctomycetaceae bacterium]|nr:formylglycine-generating enzyme family protein [Planctomycetaceae bacterium]